MEVANTILPYTSMVMAFRLKGKVLVANTGRVEIIPAAVITGLRKPPRTLRYTSSTGNLLVILREGGFRAFSNIPSYELFGESISMENLFYINEVNCLLERLAEALTNKDRIRIIETFLLSKVTIRNSYDDLIAKAIKSTCGSTGLKSWQHH